MKSGVDVLRAYLKEKFSAVYDYRLTELHQAVTLQQLQSLFEGDKVVQNQFEGKKVVCDHMARLKEQCATMPMTVQPRLQSQLHAQCHTITNRDNAQRNTLIVQKLAIQLAQCLSPLVLFLHLHSAAMLVVHCLLTDQCMAAINDAG